MVFAGEKCFLPQRVAEQSAECGDFRFDAMPEVNDEAGGCIAPSDRSGRKRAQMHYAHSMKIWVGQAAAARWASATEGVRTVTAGARELFDEM